MNPNTNHTLTKTNPASRKMKCKYVLLNVCICIMCVHNIMCVYFVSVCVHACVLIGLYVCKLSFDSLTIYIYISYGCTWKDITLTWVWLYDIVVIVLQTKS